MNTELIDELKALLTSAKVDRAKMTKEEIEELRADLSTTRALVVTDFLKPISDLKVSAELKMESLEGVEYMNYFKKLVSSNIKDDAGNVIVDGKGNAKTYTTSASESLARKALHVEGTKYYKAKKAYLNYKKEESYVYQLIKAVDQVCNALSTLTK